MINFCENHNIFVSYSRGSHVPKNIKKNHVNCSVNPYFIVAFFRQTKNIHLPHKTHVHICHGTRNNSTKHVDRVVRYCYLG